MMRAAFYAPMKPPGHPIPSGDRRIANLTMEALRRAEFSVDLASDLRVIDSTGDGAAQARMAAAADVETAAIIARYRDRPPALWFSYHCHHRAPDLIGPRVAETLGIPYAIGEPSISPKRRAGPWAAFAKASEAAIARADRLFWMSERDRPALEAAGHGPRMVALPAFLDPGPAVAPRAAGTPLRLLTVAMMRDGDKLESYKRLATALGQHSGPWQLTVIGDGPARAEVEALFATWPGRVTFRGALDEGAIRRAYRNADLLLWPGVNEGIGLVWLEAQAAGCPVVAEDGPAARAAVVGGRLAPPGNAKAFADTIEAAAQHRLSLSARARAHIEAHHTLDAAAGILSAALAPLLTGAPA